MTLFYLKKIKLKLKYKKIKIYYFIKFIYFNLIFFINFKN